MRIQREIYVPGWLYYLLVIGGSMIIRGLIAYGFIMLFMSREEVFQSGFRPSAVAAPAAGGPV